MYIYICIYIYIAITGEVVVVRTVSGADGGGGAFPIHQVLFQFTKSFSNPPSPFPTQFLSNSVHNFGGSECGGCTSRVQFVLRNVPVASSLDVNVPVEVAFEWELTEQTIYLPPGCLQGGVGVGSVNSGSLKTVLNCEVAL